MLIIESGDEVVLSPEHHALHNIGVRLHDQMADILMNEGYAPFRKVSFDIPKNAPFIEELNSGRMDVLEFMAASGMKAELTELLVSDVVQALLADFLHFLHESLSAAKRGKISVAYALLRKPMTDLLLLFEQIMVNKEEFIDRFYHTGAPIGYDPSFANLDKKAIVVAATNKLALRDLFPDDIIYDIRYNKDAKAGIAGFTHQALHIVTRNPHFHTRNRDFNFVFDSVESLGEYWANYYLVVPFLLFYAASVIDEIVFEFMPMRVRAKQVKNIQRFMLFSGLQSVQQSEEITFSEDEMFTPILDALAHTCKECNHAVRFTKPDLILFSQSTVMLCDECFTDQFTDDEFYAKFLDAWDDVVPMNPA